MNSLDKWNQAIATRYAEAVERGDHDEQCEYDVRGFYLCHCSKRRREAAGYTEVPDEELYFPPPSCPRCDDDLENDDGHWRCRDCRLIWDQYGRDAKFTDNHGDSLVEDSARWKERLDAKEKEGN